MKNTFKMKSYFPLFLLVFSLMACNEKKEAPVILIKPVKYQKVGYSNGTQVQTFPGVVKAEHETKLSFKVSGTLNTVRVELGDEVKRGQLIASIDPTDYVIQTDQARAQKEGSEANVQSSEANVKSAESQLINSRSTFDRVEKLYENNSIAISEYQQAKAGLASAKAQYDAAKAQLASAITQVTTSGKQVQAAGNQTSYTRLTAPMNGMITEVMVESNEAVGAGSPIAVLSSEGNPEIEVGVPEVLINKFKKGQKVTIEVPSAPDQKFSGKVEKVAFASGNSPTYPVVVSIDNSKQIRPGMAANVTFQFGNEKAKNKKMVIPAVSVGEDGKGNFVFLIDESSDKIVVKKQPITVGKLTSEGFVVTEGLTAGQKIAVAGLQTLLEGQEVRLQ
ncbi:MAG: multidrug efflux system membrane fusion protein [Polaribacter sp.]|jgi:multidrug efflux system membrane fusion protein